MGDRACLTIRALRPRSGTRIRTGDIRVMSPVRCHCAIPLQRGCPCTVLRCTGIHIPRPASVCDRSRSRTGQAPGRSVVANATEHLPRIPMQPGNATMGSCDGPPSSPCGRGMLPYRRSRGKTGVHVRAQPTSWAASRGVYASLSLDLEGQCCRPVLHERELATLALLSRDWSLGRLSSLKLSRSSNP